MLGSRISDPASTVSQSCAMARNLVTVIQEQAASVPTEETSLRIVKISIS